LEIELKIVAQVAVLCTCLSGPAHAFTGKFLLSSCDGSAGEWGDGACLGYLSGILQGIQFGGIVTVSHFEGYESFDSASRRSNTILKICIREAVQLDQVKLVVEKFLREHPERLHESSKFLVPDALVGAFPCD
jgi:hypothetical protein